MSSVIFIVPSTDMLSRVTDASCTTHGSRHAHLTTRYVFTRAARDLGESQRSHASDGIS